nr:MAG TPA: hypothetical protein [Caudoviricetes sp.]DAX60003.1 MAG TPA: hypothetical protein [Caudoviricetes sp.]
MHLVLSFQFTNLLLGATKCARRLFSVVPTHTPRRVDAVEVYDHLHHKGRQSFETAKHSSNLFRDLTQMVGFWTSCSGIFGH